MALIHLCDDSRIQLSSWYGRYFFGLPAKRSGATATVAL